MKKIIFTVSLALFVSMGFAQDMKKLQKYLGDKQLDKAKTEVDAMIAKDPNSGRSKLYEGKSI